MSKAAHIFYAYNLWTFNFCRFRASSYTIADRLWVYIIFAVFIGSLKLRTKFDRNRIIYGCDMEKKLFYGGRPPSCSFGHVTYTGCANKNNPLEKILYLRNCSRFFHQIYAIYRGGFRPCIHVSSKLHFNIWFDSKIITIWT